MRLDGRRVVIVGGTSGIGLAAARMAAEAGAAVTVTGRAAASLARARAALPEGVGGLALDFADAASVAAFAASVGPVDHLVLSASRTAAWGPFGAVDEAALRRAFENKFWGCWRVARALAPRVPEGGSLTFVTGAAARAAIPGMAGLAAVNGAIEAMARTLAAELAPIRVNAVSPGLTDTEVYAGMDAQARAGMFAAAAAGLPARRTGRPEDIAQAILLCLANPFLTGATLDVDGGARLARC